MSQITAQVIADSINESSTRLITFQLRYPRFVHAEFMTHRVLSRNASSSRAIPVAKMIEQVRTDPAMPVHWGKNQPGMQAREALSGAEEDFAKLYWLQAAQQAANTAELMMGKDVHKQVVNRILEPFQLISVVVTGTEWANFFMLRDHEDADPTIQALARAMKVARDASKPTERVYSRRFTEQQWHLPYVTPKEREVHYSNPQLLAKISSARLARVSYLTHEGLEPSIDVDLKLYDRLVGSVPIHASPTEHAAFVAPPWDQHNFYKNFKGWRQHREQVETNLKESHA